MTNDDMAVNLDTSDEWIVERTGHPRAPHRRHHVGPGHRGRRRRRWPTPGGRADEIDHLVLATTTPDGIVPGTAPTRAARDRHAAGAPSTSTPPARASSTASSPRPGLIAIGSGPVLLVGSETLSRITDMDDRKIAIIVGDGAGAVVVEPVDGPGSLLSWNMNSDGSLKHLLKCEHGGTLFMDGKEVFRRAVRVVVESAERAMADAGLGPDDISLMVPHQANLRIIQAACQRLGIPEERTAVVIDRYGNTSSASIPLALHDAIEARPGPRRATTCC